MFVKDVEVSKTSLSPANVPPEVEMVALARVVLVESVIVKFPDNVTGAAFSVYEIAEFKLLKTALMIFSPCQCLGWAHGVVG
jgi:hypothetical protein